MTSYRDILLEIAQNTSFSSNGLHFKANSPAVGKRLLVNFEEIFALWARAMDREYMAIQFSDGGEEIRVPASINKGNSTETREIMQTQSQPESSNLLWFANVAVNPTLLTIAHDLMENPRKAGVTRTSDELQIIMSDACSVLNPGHTLQEATTWVRSQFWHPQDLADFRRECQQNLSPDGSNTLEFTWRSFDPDLGYSNIPGNWLKFTTKYRLFDGKDGDFYQLCENLEMIEMVNAPTTPTL